MCGAALVSSFRAGLYASAARYGLNLLTHWEHTNKTFGNNHPNVVIILFVHLYCMIVLLIHCLIILGLDAVELENVLELLVQSLVKLGASQQIEGLSNWLTSRAQFAKFVDPKLLAAAALQADSRFFIAHIFQLLLHFLYYKSFEIG